MIRIKRSVIETIIGASRNVYPNEFVALLRKNRKGDIATLLLIPLSTFGADYSSIRDDMLPMNLKHCGSVHSHPTPDARPSRKDVEFFQHMGEVHMIIGYPYTEETMRVYDSNGKRQEFRVIN